MNRAVLHPELASQRAHPNCCKSSSRRYANKAKTAFKVYPNGNFPTSRYICNSTISPDMAFLKSSLDAEKLAGGGDFLRNATFSPLRALIVRHVKIVTSRLLKFLTLS
jgi:hypothetical protein